MPRKTIKIKIKQIIVYAGDECTTFELDSNEAFTKPKNDRNQILKNLRLKLYKLCPANPAVACTSQNPPISFQNPVCIDNQEKNKKMNFNIDKLQPNQTKDNVKSTDHSQTPLNLDEISNFYSDEWLDSFF